LQSQRKQIKTVSAKNPATVSLLEKKIHSHPQLTKTEAAALTGLTIDQSEGGLREMIDRYECRLQVTENGDLIYDFGNSLRRRGEKSFNEYLQEFLAKLWLVFTYIFKAGITVVLVFYCLLFLALMIALVIARISITKDSDSDSDFGFNIIAHIFLAIFQWNTASDRIYYKTDPYGYRYRHYQPKTAKKEKSKNIIAAVYDFVFGPPRVKPDSLANLRETAAFIRKNNGILVTTDLKALAGWNAADAADFFSECIARFQGDIKVSSDGIMYGEFSQLTRTISEASESEIVYYWDEYEPDYEQTGNSQLQNIVIIFANAFNLIAAGAIAFNLIPEVVRLSATFSWLPLVLGWIPLLFSLLFFLIPICRATIIKQARARRHWNNIRKRVMRIIFEMRGEPITLDEMLQKVNHYDPHTERLDRATVEKMLAELKDKLPGDISYDDNGQLRYHFPIIDMELRAAEHLRTAQNAKKDLGKIVFDSEK
jgi:hypothetical protein